MPARPKVLVTPRSLTANRHAAVDAIEKAGFKVIYAPAGQQPDETELLRLVPGCVGWLAGVEPVSEAVITAATELKAISRNGVGTDNLPARFICERQIELLTADGANAAGVAELAVGLMFAALRHIPATDAGIKSGGWPRRRGREIRGRTIGIIGCGAIGREVARMVTALGGQVVGFDPLRPDIAVPPERFRWMTIPEILRDADIVTLHCPPPDHGRPLIRAEDIATMKPDAILVNAARASLVDEEAVLKALEAGKLGIYATDVFAEEPPRSLALAGHANVIATSHIGAFTEESVDRATIIAVTNLLATIGSLGTTHAQQA